MGQVCLISGPPGCGKTSWALKTLQDHGGPCAYLRLEEEPEAGLWLTPQRTKAGQHAKGFIRWDQSRSIHGCSQRKAVNGSRNGASSCLPSTCLHQQPQSALHCCSVDSASGQNPSLQPLRRSSDRHAGQHRPQGSNSPRKDERPESRRSLRRLLNQCAPSNR